MRWQFWKPGAVLRTVEGLEPRLACWEARTHPEQVRLQGYLDELEAALGELPTPPSRLFLHMDIDVEDRARLSRHHDLENYLTPVVHRLGHKYFNLVSAKKQVGGGSRVVIGLVEPLDEPPEGHTWRHFSCRSGTGTQEKRWKAELRNSLKAAQPQPLPPGPVEVHLAWRCSPTRNWVSLWKPTGDAMGPVLGEPDPGNPFNPNDDRIVTLWLHLNADPEAGHDVDVAMRWRPAEASMYRVEGTSAHPAVPDPAYAEHGMLLNEPPYGYQDPTAITLVRRAEDGWHLTYFRDDGAESLVLSLNELMMHLMQAHPGEALHTAFVNFLGSTEALQMDESLKSEVLNFARNELGLRVPEKLLGR